MRLQNLAQYSLYSFPDHVQELLEYFVDTPKHIHRFAHMITTKPCVAPAQQKLQRLARYKKVFRSHVCSSRVLEGVAVTTETYQGAINRLDDVLVYFIITPLRH